MYNQRKKPRQIFLCIVEETLDEEQELKHKGETVQKGEVNWF